MEKKKIFLYYKLSPSGLARLPNRINLMKIMQKRVKFHFFENISTVKHYLILRMSNVALHNCSRTASS